MVKRIETDASTGHAFWCLSVMLEGCSCVASFSIDKIFVCGCHKLSGICKNSHKFHLMPVLVKCAVDEEDC